MNKIKMQTKGLDTQTNILKQLKNLKKQKQKQQQIKRQNQKKQQMLKMNVQKHKLAIMCQIKNVSKYIHTWLKHHIWQGVEHFYLIDDDSNDDIKEKLQEYIDLGIVSYYYKPGFKVNNYRWLFENIKKEMEWLLICDIEDYFYCLETSLSNKINEFKNTNILLSNLYVYKYKQDEIYLNENDVDLRCFALNRYVQLSQNARYIFRPNSIVSSQISEQGLVYLVSNRLIQNAPKTKKENISIRVNHYLSSNHDNQMQMQINDTSLKDLIEK